MEDHYAESSGDVASAGGKGVQRRFARRPQMLKNLIFARALYELKVNRYTH